MDSDNHASVSSSVLRSALSYEDCPEFSLIEVEDDMAAPFNYSSRINTSVKVAIDNSYFGIDDIESATPINREPVEKNPTISQFSASPVLISCLRDIARMAKPDEPF